MGLENIVAAVCPRLRSACTNCCVSARVVWHACRWVCAVLGCGGRPVCCRGACCRVGAQDEDGWNVLHWAAVHNTNEKVAELLLRHNADVTAKARGSTTLPGVAWRVMRSSAMWRGYIKI